MLSTTATSISQSENISIFNLIPSIIEVPITKNCGWCNYNDNTYKSYEF